MTLEEAIKHAEEVAYQKDLESGFETDNERYAMTDKERADCKECAEEHKQLAEWLKDYKRLLEQPCEDAISRQAVEQLSRVIVHTTRDKADFLCNFWEGLQKLPPVKPQPKTGRWTYIKNSSVNGLKICECSNCNKKTYGSHNYCPNCGIKMVDSQERENKE